MRLPWGGGGDDEDNVYVIGHDDERPQFDVYESGRDLIQLLLSNSSNIGQLHLAVHDFPKQAFPPLRANGDEIHPRRGVIVAGQAYGSAMVGLGHG